MPGVRLGGLAFKQLVYDRQTGDDTPTVEGVSGDPVGTVLTVTINGTGYPATVLAGQVWSVTTTPLAAGRYDVLVAGVSGSVLFEDVLRVLGPTWAFHDGAGGLDDHVWTY